MYRYETHMHTSPVSKCASSDVSESLEFYKQKGYDGIFLTNHFLDSNIGCDRSAPYEEQINFFYSDFEKAVEVGKNIGLKVFDGVELSYGGTDFLVYGLDKEWFLSHPEIMEMKKSEELPLMMNEGALVIQAHPFREARYIDHIRLYPRCVHGIETINACRTDFENEMADKYADNYGLLKIAGSDNHFGPRAKKLAGIMTKEPICSVGEFISVVKDGKCELFYENLT